MSSFLEDGLQASKAGQGKSPIDPTRRGFLRTGLMGGALLTGGSMMASLSGCSKPPETASGLQLLRADDRLFFEALYPVVMGASLSTEPGQRAQQLSQAITSLDQYLSRIAPVMQGQLMQLLDLVHTPITRGPVTGVWNNWSSASAEQVSGYLLRWKNSSVQVFRMGYGLLMQLMVMSWYLVPDTWQAVGYPGPPHQSQLLTPPNNF
ncbi:hypothetical protein MIB92_00810 [Aestuariirhabdus sp. Z084]|uniref:hypothetical protein n=1 Tax=Aestuariirhabdus haliotis TaxID=2918751 RepID=UPI00201B3951|nr:hypothetical protein [Aestuariirhabdus haliotis]MCL6414177.1 hypothetical protein [Aestuariirhabdus haliotis]MCL6418109.1 hypothetical protein [Aestuariirhabdus haliotis]